MERLPNIGISTSNICPSFRAGALGGHHGKAQLILQYPSSGSDKVVFLTIPEFNQRGRDQFAAMSCPQSMYVGTYLQHHAAV